MPDNIENLRYRIKVNINIFINLYNSKEVDLNQSDDLIQLIIAIYDINSSLSRLVPDSEKIRTSKANLLQLAHFEVRNENSELKKAIITKYYEILQDKDINNQILQIITELSQKRNFRFTESSTLSPNDTQFFGRR